MPASREPQPYRPPAVRRGPVPDLSETPSFLRRWSAATPAPIEPVPLRRWRDAPDGTSPESLRRWRAEGPAADAPRTGIRGGSGPRSQPAARVTRPDATAGPSADAPSGTRPARAGIRDGRSPRLAHPAVHRGAVPGARPTQGPTPGRPALPDPASLPIPSLSRRRLATLAGGLAAAWLVVAFGRQVGAASAATDRVQQLRVGNTALAAEVASLQAQASQVTSPGYVQQAARAVRLGGPGEIPFALAADAPSLAPDAPGSASTRLGTTGPGTSPLDGWISLLVGSGS